MQGTVSVTRPGSAALRLGALHHASHPLVVETEDLPGTLDHHAHLVMVLTAGEACTVRGRPDLDQQDRLIR